MVAAVGDDPMAQVATMKYIWRLRPTVCDCLFDPSHASTKTSEFEQRDRKLIEQPHRWQLALRSLEQAQEG